MERGGSSMHKFLSGLLAGVALAARGARRARGARDRRPANRGGDPDAVRRTGDHRRPHVPVHRRCGGAPLRRDRRQARHELDAGAHARRRRRGGRRAAAVRDARRMVRLARRARRSTRSPARTSPSAATSSSTSSSTRTRQSASVGSCGDPIGTGDRVLFAVQRRQRSAAGAGRPEHRKAGRDRDRQGHRRRQRRGDRGRDGRRRDHGRGRYRDRRALHATRRAGPQGVQARHGALQPVARVRERWRGRLLQHGGAGGRLSAVADRA